jgi:hypothetical protein
MHKDDNPDQIKHEHIVERVDSEARIFMMVAAALMVAEISFGLLNSLNVIHM